MALCVLATFVQREKIDTKPYMCIFSIANIYKYILIQAHLRYFTFEKCVTMFSKNISLKHMQFVSATQWKRAEVKANVCEYYTKSSISGWTIIHSIIPLVMKISQNAKLYA